MEGQIQGKGTQLETMESGAIGMPKGIMRLIPKSSHPAPTCVGLFPKNKRDRLASSTIQKMEV
jgi:hypothetical protein